MAVPDFQSLMLPLLRLSRDGAERTMADSRPLLATEFNLTAEDLALRNSGGTATFTNRVSWAKIHLERAGLLESTRRGWFKITSEGAKVLESPPERLDLRFLNRFPGSVAFRNRPGNDGGSSRDEVDESDTPLDAMDAAYKRMKSALAQEVLDKVRGSPPSFLETLVVDLLQHMGYGGVGDESGIVTPLSGDEGIDGIINEDRLGLDVIYLQAKRWERPVGRPEVQKFVGALHGKRARK